MSHSLALFLSRTFFSLRLVAYPNYQHGLCVSLLICRVGTLVEPHYAHYADFP